MNLERYKAEMSRNIPDRRFIEGTLNALKNNHRQSKINMKQVFKTIGGLSLTAAVLCGAVIGGGAVRSLFNDGEAFETSITLPPAETELENGTPEPTETKGIIATDNELLASPLASNPDYTVRAVTPEGRVELNEDTTIEEMLACGVTVNTEHGILGLRYFCEAVKKQIDGKPFEYIYADTKKGNIYNYYDVDKNGDIQKRWEYNHLSHFYIVKWIGSTWSNKFSYYAGPDFEYTGVIVLNENENVGFINITDLLEATCYDKEERKEMYYFHLTNEGEPFLGVIYNDENPSAFRLNYFIEKINNGVDYASVQFSDITTTREYNERLYSIEYVNGTYSIFTLTNGVNGTYDTQYFDGYKISGNNLIFDNGEIRYSFKMKPEKDTISEALCYTDRPYLLKHDDFSYFITVLDADYDDLIFDYDKTWVDYTIRYSNLRNLLVVNEEYSTNFVLACEVEDYYYNKKREGIKTVKLKTTDNILATNEKGISFRMGTVTIEGSVNDELVTDMPDGKRYVMIKPTSEYHLNDNGINVNGDCIEINLYAFTSDRYPLVKCAG